MVLALVRKADAFTGEFEDVWEEVAEIVFASPKVDVISDRQFFQQLSLVRPELVSRAEALAAVKTGELPVSIASFVAAITDEDERYAAEMVLSGATEFRRGHALVDVFGAHLGMSAADLDAFWLAASQL